MTIRKWTITKGEMWTEQDEALKTKVCVIGTTAAEGLFGDADPIGRIVRIGRSPYRVIGLLGSRGNSPGGDDQDDRIMMPIGSFRSRVMHTSPGRADQLVISATSEQTTDRAEQEIESILRQRHKIQPGREPDFQIHNMAEFKEAQAAMMNTIAILLSSVAAISLIVGGIGVMNIMLVSVAERTREIGIRMSIGARMRDIRSQFLVEAQVLCLFGGLLGAALGLGATALVGSATGWPLHPSLKALGLGLLVSVIIGTIFGFLPARRAARLDPIDALRTE
jgi:putative ABC transport system permease protein